MRVRRAHRRSSNNTSDSVCPAGTVQPDSPANSGHLAPLFHCSVLQAAPYPTEQPMDCFIRRRSGCPTMDHEDIHSLQQQQQQLQAPQRELRNGNCHAARGSPGQPPYADAALLVDKPTAIVASLPRRLPPIAAAVRDRSPRDVAMVDDGCAGEAVTQCPWPTVSFLGRRGLSDGAIVLPIVLPTRPRTQRQLRRASVAHEEPCAMAG